ncbi:KilA-like protein (plasmid) [Calothrix sp. NIES-4071]|nr:KilA-like protein [Calothrix sp. NIES-4071]BAZ64952.1 KilA-like protein [Calothrix sp. NIES-4105]
MSDSNEEFTDAIVPQAIITRTIQSSVVEQRASDGYINATALASAYKKATGKRRDVASWLELERTKETLEHLSSITGKRVIELYQAFRGSPENGGGTWIHPKLGVRFAIWLSDEFGYIVEEWVEQWRLTGQSPIDSPNLTTTITTAVSEALVPITQRLDVIEQRLKVLPGAKPKRPWTLSASTPETEVPDDYVQLEDGSWLSPEAYQSILRQSRRSLPWELRRLKNTD